MRHAIRPESYIAMDNFYTATVYRKGAEVIRMYHTLLGADGFRKGMDLYFERHDGQAVTCDDFRAAMADANKFDLTQFERWYTQCGTPSVTCTKSYSAADKALSLTLEQTCAPSLHPSLVPSQAWATIPASPPAAKRSCTWTLSGSWHMCPLKAS